MNVKTRLFGEINIEDEKIITLHSGLIGFPNMKKFTLLFDNEKDDEKSIMWFQSLDEPDFAMPVMLPNDVVPDYNPTVNDEYLLPLGDLNEDNTYVIVTLKVPSNIENMTINLKAPIVINTDTLIGEQIIVEEKFEVRFPIYNILKAAKESAGE